MNEQNLTMMGKARGLTSEEAQEMGRKGGSVKSPAKRWAARLRDLKKKGLKDDTIKNFVDVMEDPNCCDLDCLLSIESGKNEMSKEAYNKLKMMWRKFHHGEKHNIEASIAVEPVTININFPEKKKESVESGGS